MLSRRSFLLGSAALGGAALLAGDNSMTLAMRTLRGHPKGLGTLPPTDDSWTKYAGNPILVPSGWESTVVTEQSIMYDGTWRMAYLGSSLPPWTTSAVGVATSPDGYTWTKYAGNPVLGMGVGDEAGALFQPSALQKIGSTYYLWYANSSHELCIATSTDFFTWANAYSDVLAYPPGVDQWNNCTVVLDGTTYRMLVEGHVSSPSSTYHIFYATSPDAVTWTIGNGGSVVSGLNAGGFDGQPSLFHKSFGGLWHLWYSTGASAVDSAIYHATSSDFVTWTRTTPNPVLDASGSGFEGSTVQKPGVLVVAGTAFLFYTGFANVDETSESIGVATARAVR